MIPPLDDTIVAIATGWSPAALGIVRLSGPAAFDIMSQLGSLKPASASTAHWTSGRVSVCERGATLPAEAFWFPAPRSFTGQHMAELHVCGALPLLRILAARALQAGARAAVPGEFTARAYRAGKIDMAQVAAVLDQLGTGNAGAARSAARSMQDSVRDRLRRVEDAVAELLSLIEAGIDFVEEEDVRFINPDEIRGRLSAIRALLGDVPQARERWGLPHVVLAGRPSAGKSTLLNALAGAARAIVSPILGTTRDVLTIEVDLLAGVRIALVDTPGRLIAPDRLESAALAAAEHALESADVVLWLHDAAAAWTAAERAEFERLPAERRMLVLTKSDLALRSDLPEGIRVSALADPRCAALREAISLKLSESPPMTDPLASATKILQAREAIARCVELDMPELLALELRLVLDLLSAAEESPVDERVLDQIFSKFCVGK